MQVTDVTIGDFNFYIRPFHPFTANKILFKLKNILAGSLDEAIPLISEMIEQDNKGVMDIELDSRIIPVVFKALKNLDGDTAEELFLLLLLNHKNIAFLPSNIEGDKGTAKALDEDAINVAFTGELQDLYLLCVHVLKINYLNFFVKAPNRFGEFIKDIKSTWEKTQERKDTSQKTLASFN